MKKIFIVGCIDKSENIKSLWLVYGDCYCAKPGVYTRVKDKITNSINELGIELSETNKIAKVKKVDPLGIMDLRVRGMWEIKHQAKYLNILQQQAKSLNVKRKI